MNNSEFPRTYLGVPEKEVFRLVRHLAFRMKLSPPDVDDVQQLVLEALAGVTFDPAMAQGSRPRTFISSIIKNKILERKRADGRRERRCQTMDLDAVEPSDDRKGASNGAHETPPVSLYAREEPVDLQIDLKEALASLPERDRRVCIALSEGRNITEIAKMLDCGRDTVGRAIARVRKCFAELGLDEWIATKRERDEGTVRS